MDYEKAAFIKDCIITIISDDFESFEIITTQIKPLLLSKGMIATEEEVASILETVIGEGFAEAYVLSSREPHSTRAVYSPERIRELWYYATKKGKTIAKRISKLIGEE